MKYAVCTLAANKEYIQGALNLYYSYNNLGLPYDFVIMLPIYLKDSNLPIRNNLKYYCYEQEYFFINVEVDRHKTTFNKFQALKLIEYDKVLFLDADFIFNNNRLNNLTDMFVQEVNTFKAAFIIATTSTEIENFKKLFPDYFNCWNEKMQSYIRAVGQWILFKPNIIYFNTLLKYLPLVKDDEMLMTYEFSSVIENSLSITTSAYHWTQYPKYWQIYQCTNWEELITNLQKSAKLITRLKLKKILED